MIDSWCFVRGEGWRPDLTYLCLLHKEFGTLIELDVDNGKSFVFLAGSDKSSLAKCDFSKSKVRFCREDAYVTDWKFNALDLIRGLFGEGQPLLPQMTEGKWSFAIQEPKRWAQRAFDRYNEDGDAEISPKELKPLLQDMGFAVIDEDVEKMLESADSDGNGGIDFSEFCKMIAIDKEDPIMLITSAESSCEIWLTNDGFVFCANESKDDAIVTLKGYCPPYSVQKAAAWLSLGKAVEALKRREMRERVESEIRAALAAKEEQERIAREALEATERYKTAKAERRRLREAAAEAAAASGRREMNPMEMFGSVNQ